MDIFTTQLTRVVQIPIKPASLKVKALLKEAANSKLSDDANHLENHEYYFTSEEDKYHSSQQEADDKEESENSSETNNDASVVLDENDVDAKKTTGKSNGKHLDLYA
ncbi:hypothetical protein CMT41_13530 [Colwellia sp. MT41]|uniref:hypothetical protein n=1 Tax=Colwellia sp. MT41 TaxID=58049 RepID=UPI0007177E1F|nr:hypothetical protein [Colwellia sp. MT41]ALO35621.1 hypothetical protein CMT41_13530 [Colwellia sp. MT41]